MGKVICVPGLSCCHIIHHNFQFKALICFYFLARVKHASFPGELSHVHYSCAVWRSVPEWAVKSWKTVVWKWQKAGSVRDLADYPLLSGEEDFAKSCELLRQKCWLLYLLSLYLWIWETSEFAGKEWTAKILHIHIVSLELCEKNMEEGGYLRCLKPACFATHWIPCLCKKTKFSPFVKQLDVKTLGWGCLLE